MSILPLYNSLKTDTDGSDLTPELKELILKNIKELDEKGLELVFILIKLFEMETNPEAKDGLPYECKFIAKEYRFDLDKIPNRLKHIILKFTNMHVKNMHEEDIISSERKILNV